MKLAIKALFGVFVSLVVIVMIAPYFIDLNSYKSQIIETAEEKTGLDIVVDGDVTLSILPMPSFSVSDVTVSEASEQNSEPNISFKRLSINVELIPLFSGRIAVKSVSIDNPVIQVVKHKDGSINILNLLDDANNSNKDEEAAPSDTTSNKALPDVSFNVVRIKDGTFYYKDEATKTENIVRNVNLEVSAENLMGPYSADGSLFYNGHAIEFELKSDAYDDKEKVISPQITMNIEPIGVNLVFSGAVNLLEETPALQGHVEVNLKDLSQLSQMKTAATPLNLSGVLSANETKISMSNMKGALGTNKFTGMASLDLKTLKEL